MYCGLVCGEVGMMVWFMIGYGFVLGEIGGCRYCVDAWLVNYCFLDAKFRFGWEFIALEVRIQVVILVRFF